MLKTDQRNLLTSNKLSNAVALAMTSILQPSACNQVSANCAAQQTSTFGSNSFGTSHNGLFLKFQPANFLLLNNMYFWFNKYVLSKSLSKFCYMF